jgi:hypothetical protein
MVNRVSALCLILGLVIGFALAGPSARAQSSEGLPFPVNQDDKIALHFEHGTLGDTVVSIDCTVDELQGTWVRCRSSDSFQAQRQQRWYSLKRVIQITKQQK